MWVGMALGWVGWGEVEWGKMRLGFRLRFEIGWGGGDGVRVGLGGMGWKGEVG